MSLPQADSTCDQYFNCYKLWVISNVSEVKITYLPVCGLVFLFCVVLKAAGQRVTWK